MHVGKVKWYESFWTVLICFLISPITGFLSLFPAIIFILLRLKKEIKRITINKKNGLPLNTIIPYEEPSKDIESKVKSNDDGVIIEKPSKQNPLETHPKVPEDHIDDPINDYARNNLSITISGPSKNRKNTTPRNSPKKKYDYSKIRKLTTDFVVLDFEITGLSPVDNNIIQIGAIRYSNLELIEEYNTLVNPNENISSTITKITGITNADVLAEPTINQVLPTLLEFINNDVIVAHNASFDMKFLLENIARLNLTTEKFRVIDTLSLARKHIDETPNHKLPTLKSFLNLDHFESHDALADCKVTGELYKYCFNKSLAVR